MTKRYILGHGGCADGYAAMFAFWLKYGYENIEYIPVTYHKPIPDMDERSEVYIVDFSYSATELMDLSKRMNKIVVLDHHDTAQKNLEGLDLGPRHKIIFDMTKSGAVLAWEYLYPDKDVPMFFRYIQDRDLWQWNLIMSREFSAGLASIPQTFEEWHKHWIDYFPIISRGDILWSYQCNLIKKLLAATTNRVIGGYSIPCINSPILQSELGEALLEKHQDAPFVGCWYLDKDQNEIWSLRSRKSFSCNTIAEGYGGGGHPQASGFKISNQCPHCAAHVSIVDLDNHICPFNKK